MVTLLKVIARGIGATVMVVLRVLRLFAGRERIVAALYELYRDPKVIGFFVDSGFAASLANLQRRTAELVGAPAAEPADHQAHQYGPVVASVPCPPPYDPEEAQRQAHVLQNGMIPLLGAVIESLTVEEDPATRWTSVTVQTKRGAIQCASPYLNVVLPGLTNEETIALVMKEAPCSSKS